MTPTPSPRPAALVIEAMRAAEFSHAELDAFRLMLEAASNLGWCLIPRAELEEAAATIDACAVMPSPALNPEARRVMTDRAEVLRQRSRG